MFTCKGSLRHVCLVDSVLLVDKTEEDPRTSNLRLFKVMTSRTVFRKCTFKAQYTTKLHEKFTTCRKFAMLRIIMKTCVLSGSVTMRARQKSIISAGKTRTINNMTMTTKSLVILLWLRETDGRTRPSLLILLDLRNARINEQLQYNRSNAGEIMPTKDRNHRNI